MQGMEQRQSLQQKQTLRLSQAMKQSLQMMKLPATELRASILNEVERNPALEIVSDPLNTKHQEHKSDDYKTLSSYRQERSKDRPYSDSQASDRYQKFLESIPDNTHETLQSHLLEQFIFGNYNQEYYEFVLNILYNLDDKGFNIITPEELIEKYNSDSETKKISNDKAMKLFSIIQKFEPVGCAVNNCMDSLSVQAEFLFSNKIKYNDNYFYVIDLLKNNRECFKNTTSVSGFFKCIKSLDNDYVNLTLEDAEEIMDIIGTLNPSPGQQFSNSSENNYIIPEIFIEKIDTGLYELEHDDDELQVIVDNEILPTVDLNDDFKKMTDENKSNSEAKKYLKEALSFIESLNYRKNTLAKLAFSIKEHQRDFFMNGPKYLKPLSQKDVADELGVHESTVSRIANDKYLYCDWGVFNIKYFFSNEISSNNNSEYSKNAIKAIIQELLDENSCKKLSDQKIADILKERDITISRRTVNKYRKELGIDSSYSR